MVQVSVLLYVQYLVYVVCSFLGCLPVWCMHMYMCMYAPRGLLVGFAMCCTCGCTFHEVCLWMYVPRGLLVGSTFTHTLWFVTTHVAPGPACVDACGVCCGSWRAHRVVLSLLATRSQPQRGHVPRQWWSNFCGACGVAILICLSVVASLLLCMYACAPSS